MKRAAGLLVWFLVWGFVVEGLGVILADERFSVTAALGIGVLFASGFALLALVEEHVERPLSRFFAWALGFGVLLILIAPVGRGDGVDPIPNLYVAVGIAALFAAMDRLTTSKRLTRWAEEYRRRHAAS